MALAPTSRRGGRLALLATLLAGLVLLVLLALLLLGGSTPARLSALLPPPTTNLPGHPSLPPPPPPPLAFFADWTDPALFDDARETALGQTCAFSSPLDRLPFALAAQLRAPPAPSNSSSPTAPSLGSSLSHDTTASGLLSANATFLSAARAQHPLFALLRAGEDRFHALLARQSSTLAEAEEAYRTRNEGRAPPAEFERWWQFASENNVLFPDEHAATALLAPFRALSPSERQRRLALASRSPAGTAQALVRIVNGPSGLGWAPLQDADGRERARPRDPPRIHKRTRAHLALLQPIAHLLPHFSAVLNNADQPVVLLDPKTPGALEDEADPPTCKVDWRAFCARRTNGSAPAQQDAPQVAFVEDVRRASDPCLNPSLLDSHGYFLQDVSGKSTDLLPLTHRQLVPILSLSSTVHHADILAVPVGIEGRLEHVGPLDVAWADKADKMYWRGSATGMYNHAPASAVDAPLWPHSHRPRLSRFANDDSPLSSSSSSAAPALAVDGATGTVVLAPPASAATWKRRWMDVHLASTVFWRWFSWWPETGQQCEWWSGTCKALARGFSYVSKDPPGTSDLAKYALDVDGNGWSARFPRLMAARSLVVKATAFTEWNGQTFPAHYGYVPANNDYSDIESILSFLQTPELDAVAREMADVGRCWKARTMRVVDMQAYMLRLYIEFADVFGSDQPEADGAPAEPDVPFGAAFVGEPDSLLLKQPPRRPRVRPADAPPA